MWFSMCVWFKVVFLMPFIGLTHGRLQNVTTPEIDQAKNECSDTVLKEIQECWDKLSAVSVHGIPSSPQKIEETCSVYVKGMECVSYWSRTCLSKEEQDQLQSSVIGAMQIYKVLCTDTKFQEDYLKHANCYQRISPHWDDCNNKFTRTLGRIDHAKDLVGLCCLRQRYIQCVDKVTSVLCSNDANKFLQFITESLMQSPMDAYHSSLCKNLDENKCKSSSSAGCHAVFFRMFGFPFWNFTLSFISTWMLTFFT